MQVIIAKELKNLILQDVSEAVSQKMDEYGGISLSKILFESDNCGKGSFYKEKKVISHLTVSSKKSSFVLTFDNLSMPISDIRSYLLMENIDLDFDDVTDKLMKIFNKVSFDDVLYNENDIIELRFNLKVSEKSLKYLEKTIGSIHIVED